MCCVWLSLLILVGSWVEIVIVVFGLKGCLCFIIFFVKGVFLF